MDKLERLLDLTAELLHTARPLSADQIQERLPGYPAAKASFKRAFERDKADLREMGIPIRVETIPGTDPELEGYRIDPDEYYLPDPGFTADELAAIHLASTTIRLDGTDPARGLSKLGVGAGASRNGGPGSAVATLPSYPGLAEVFDAVGSRSRIRFTYNGRDREVSPHRLHHQRGRWYLRGFDHGADEPRTFRLDRLEGTVTVGVPASAVDSDDSGPLRLQGWEIGDDEPIAAVVRVAPAQARIAVRSCGDDVEVTTQDDGGVVLTFPVRRRDAFRSFVLGFLDDAEVLGPEELRHDIVSWLQAIAAEGEG